MSRRARARFNWSAVAFGPLDHETHEWIRGVARKMLDADKIEGDLNRRASAIVAATGLTGRREDQADSIELALNFFEHLQTAPREPDQTTQSPPADARKFVAQVLGWNEDDVNDEALDRRITRALSSLDEDHRARYLAILNRRPTLPTRKV